MDGQQTIARGPVIAARLRMPALWIGAALFIASWIFGISWFALGGLIGLAVGFALYFGYGTVEALPRLLRSPLDERWVAENSPGSRVPSHGVHALGQTWAIDLIPEPGPGTRPAFGWRNGIRDPSDYPGFGVDVVAPVGGVVTRAHDRARDHRSRASWPAYALMFIEGSVRELLGPRFILGNHVVIETDAGEWAALAHLQHGSVRVERGQRVEPGEVIGSCGMTGNTSEPHVHLQLQDHPWPVLAAGLPFVLTDIEPDVGALGWGGLPENGAASRPTNVS